MPTLFSNPVTGLQNYDNLNVTDTDISSLFWYSDSKSKNSVELILNFRKQIEIDEEA